MELQSQCDPPSDISIEAARGILSPHAGRRFCQDTSLSRLNLKHKGPFASPEPSLRCHRSEVMPTMTSSCSMVNQGSTRKDTASVEGSDKGRKSIEVDLDFEGRKDCEVVGGGRDVK